MKKWVCVVKDGEVDGVRRWCKGHKSWIARDKRLLCTYAENCIEAWNKFCAILEDD